MRSLRVLGIPVLLAVAGCAAAGGGSTQQLTVETDPPGATCRLVRLGQSVGEVRSTPGVVVVERTKTDIEVICGKDGYDEARFINKSEFNSATVGSILLGGAIGLAADAASGAINKYDEKVVLTLVPRPAGSGTASVSPSPTPFSPSAQEIALWESIRNSDEADDYAFYLKRFPSSPRAPQAQARLNALRIPPPAAPVVAAVVAPPPAVSQVAPQAVAGVPPVALPPAAAAAPAPPTPNLADQREAARNSAPAPLGSESSDEPVSAADTPTPAKPVAPAPSAAPPQSA